MMRRQAQRLPWKREGTVQLQCDSCGHQRVAHAAFLPVLRERTPLPSLVALAVRAPMSGPCR